MPGRSLTRLIRQAETRAPKLRCLTVADIEGGIARIIAALAAAGPS
jgi:hypothetical protein